MEDPGWNKGQLEEKLKAYTDFFRTTTLDPKSDEYQKIARRWRFIKKHYDHLVRHNLPEIVINWVEIGSLSEELENDK